jgi:hypothetical protein
MNKKQSFGKFGWFYFLNLIYSSQREKRSYPFYNREGRNTKICLVRNLLAGVILLLISFSFPTPVRAEDFWSKFHPYITITEEYNDNIFLTKENKTGDFITTVYPGIQFSHSSEGMGIDFNYMLGLNYYSQNSNLNYTSHNGMLNAWYRFDPRWTFRLREYLLQSDEPREKDFGTTTTSDVNFVSTSRDRSVYLRNVVEPSLEYQFGRENLFTFLYRNNTYLPQSSASENSQENTVNPTFNYWFNIRNGMLLEYMYTSGTFESSPDFTEHKGRGRYIYRFNPRTSIFGEYLFSSVNYKSPGTSYTLQNPSLGVEHAFSATLNGRGQLGYFWQDTKGIPGLDGLSYYLGISKKADLTSFAFAFEGGPREDYFTSQNLGLVKYNRASVLVTYQLGKRSNAGFNGSVDRVEYSQTDPGRIDWISDLAVTFSYQPLRWLTIGLEFSYSQNDSNKNQFDYIENRGLVRLTAKY